VSNSNLPGADEPVTITFGFLFDMARYVQRSAVLMLPLMRHEAEQHEEMTEVMKECTDLLDLGKRVSATLATIATIERARL
jgi:hypothetical protein